MNLKVNFRYTDGFVVLMIKDQKMDFRSWLGYIQLCIFSNIRSLRKEGEFSYKIFNFIGCVVLNSFYTCL